MIKNNFQPIFIESGPLAHEAVEELQNNRVVIRALAQKNLKIKKPQSIMVLPKKINFIKEIKKQLNYASIRVIFLLFRKLIKDFFMFIMKFLLWIIFDYIPIGKCIFKFFRINIKKIISRK